MIPALLLGGGLETLSERISLAAIFVHFFAVKKFKQKGLTCCVTGYDSQQNSKNKYYDSCCTQQNHFVNFQLYCLKTTSKMIK